LALCGFCLVETGDEFIVSIQGVQEQTAWKLLNFYPTSTFKENT